MAPADRMQMQKWTMLGASKNNSCSDRHTSAHKESSLTCHFSGMRRGTHTFSPVQHHACKNEVGAPNPYQDDFLGRIADKNEGFAKDEVLHGEAHPSVRGL